MNRIAILLFFGLGLLAFAAQPANQAAGVLKSGQHSFDRKTALMRTTKSVTVNVAKNIATKTPKRIQKPTPRPMHSVASASHIEVFDAYVQLLSDRDGDGFYRQFQLDVDVDSLGYDTEVYLRIYYRSRNSDWLLLDTSAPFWVRGENALDVWQAVYTLTDGFLTDWYELAIDVYDANTDEWMASTDGTLDIDLYDVPLEDRWADGDAQGFSLSSLGMQLSIDHDSDGFFRQFYIDLSVRWTGASRPIRAILYSRGSDGQWYQEALSSDVLLVNGDSVTFEFDGLWENGYPTDYYDFLIDLVDVDTGEIFMTVGPENSALAQAPMESADWDEPSSTVIVTTTVGGSMEWVILSLLGFVSLQRRRTH